MKAVFDGEVIAESDEVVQIESNWYYPPASVKMDKLTPNPMSTVCPWKGLASYYDVTSPKTGEVRQGGAWQYKEPKPAAKEITGFIAFYPFVQHEN
jgi:uncharacterized protein (DUF427 family)